VLSSSLALRYHLGVLLFRSLSSPFQERIPCRNGTTLQHFPETKTRFLFEKRVAVLFSRSTLRVWLPFQWFLVSIPCEAYFSFERSWAYPYSALLLLDDRKKVPLLLSALALSYQTLLKPDTGASAT
jgi:hypothetical protein